MQPGGVLLYGRILKPLIIREVKKMDLPLLQNTQSSVSVTCPRLLWHVQDLLWQQHPVGALCAEGV